MPTFVPKQAIMQVLLVLPPNYDDLLASRACFIRSSSGSQDLKVPRSTLWLFNIAMKNGPFIDVLPIKNGDFPWLC
jgi:hypothetical protein